MVAWLSDVSAADWIVDQLHPFASDLGSVLPAGFPAYGRVLHPAWRHTPGARTRVRWAELADAAGVTLRSTSRIEALEAATRDPAVELPEVGGLEPGTLEALAEHLGESTSTPQACWFAVWEGWGHLQGPPAVVELRHEDAESQPRARPRATPPARWTRARVAVPQRPMLLAHGPLAAAADFATPPFGQSPNLWWPQDRAWCVASEIEFSSTYVGGEHALIERLLAAKDLEVLPIAVTERVTD